MDATARKAVTTLHPQWGGRRSQYQRRAQEKYHAATEQLVSPWAIIRTDCETDMCLRVQCMDVMEPVKIEYPRSTCVYCGEGTTGYDHLLPRAWTGEQFRKQVAIVPCCAHCNSVINDLLSISVTERRRVCHERLRRRNRDLLNSPDRQPWEYQHMGYVMAQSAKAYAVKKQRLLARLAWPVDPHYDRRAFEKTGIEYAGEMGLM